MDYTKLPMTELTKQTLEQLLDGSLTKPVLHKRRARAKAAKKLNKYLELGIALNIYIDIKNIT